MAIAVEIFDPSRQMYPYIAVRNGALEGNRFFVADTQDPLAAINAIGLPALGDAHPNAPQLKAVDFDPRREGPETTFVHVIYRFDAVGGVPAPDPDNVAQDGDAYSEIVPGMTQVEARTDVTPPPGTRVLPTPVSIEAPTQELIVHVYTSGPVSDAAITDFLPLRGKINSNQVIAPPRWTMTANLALAPGMLLARTFSEEIVREGLSRVSFRFGLAPAGGWVSEQAQLDSNGNQTGPVSSYDVYRSVNYNTGPLWSV